MSDQPTSSGPQDAASGPTVPETAAPSVQAASADAAPGGPPQAPEEALDRVTPYQAAQRVSPWGYVFVAGVTGLLTGFAWYRVEENVSVVSQAWIFIAALLTLAPIAWHSVDFFQSVASRRGGAFLAVVATVTLGCVVMAAVSALNVKFRERIPSLDLTESGRYTLGEETKKILEKIPEGGVVYATYLQRQGGDFSLREMAMEQLRVYGFQSTKVVVREFDDFREKDAAESYLRSHGVETTSSGEDADVIVLSWAEPGREVALGKQKEVPVLQSSFASMGSMDGQPKWLGERLLTSAIQELVFTRFKAYLTGGHGERSFTEDARELRDRLAAQNVEVVDKPLDLTSAPNVPDDCDLLLILGPEAEFKAEETAAVRAWLEKGKALFVSFDVDPTGTRRATGLEPLLDTFGIAPRINYQVFVPFLERTSIGIQRTMVPQFAATARDYASHPAVDALRRGGGFATYFLLSSFVEVETEAKSGLTVEPLIWAPDPGIKEAGRPYAARLTPNRRSLHSIDESTDIVDRRLALVAAARRDLAAEGAAEKKDARLVVSGDTDCFTDQVTKQNGPNLDLFGGLVQWGLRREDLAAVSEKTVEMEVASIGPREHRMAFWWPLVTALGALLAGATVWWTRRR